MKTEKQASPDLEKIRNLIEDFNVAMVTTLDAGDRMVARPMSPLKMDSQGVLWFFTSLHSYDATQLESVNLAFSDEDASRYVSLTGYAELSIDSTQIEHLWTPMIRPWFPQGKDSADLAILRFTPQSAEYWDSTHSKMVRMLALAASVIVAEPIGMGEHRTLFDLANP